MTSQLFRTTAIATVLLAVSIPVTPSLAQESDDDSVAQRIEQLERELAELKAMIADTADTADRAEMAATEARETAMEANDTAQSARMEPVAYEGKIPDTMWHIAGYTTAGVKISNGDESDTFFLGKFNPGFHFQYKDLLLFEGELEFEIEDNETEVELEYASLDLLLHDNVTLLVGKYLSPIGQFQERLHPDWINKAATTPIGFGHDGVQPLSDVGIQLRGGIPLGEDFRATYAFAVGNGPQFGHEGGVELEGFAEDDNSNKSIGGRIGFFPLPYLEVGGSYLTAKVDGLEGVGEDEPTRADFDLWGFDAAYTDGPWDVRFEYLKSTRDELFSAEEEGEEVELFEKQTLKAWYAQAAYRLSDIDSSVHLQRLEPVFRYGQLRAEHNHELEEIAQNNYYFGLNYWLAPSFVIRGGYEIRDFRDPEASNEKIFQLEASYGF